MKMAETIIIGVSCGAAIFLINRLYLWLKFRKNKKYQKIKQLLNISGKLCGASVKYSESLAGLITEIKTKENEGG